MAIVQMGDFINVVIGGEWCKSSICTWVYCWIEDDAPPSSLMDSTVNPKVKTMEGKKVGVHSLAHNISGVEGRAEVSKWD